MTKNEFYSAWLSHFANGISKENIEKYVVSTGNYLWHVFSQKLLDKKVFLTGNSARKAYDKIDKHNALYIDWFEDRARVAMEVKILAEQAELQQNHSLYVILRSEATKNPFAVDTAKILRFCSG